MDQAIPERPALTAQTRRRTSVISADFFIVVLLMSVAAALYASQLTAVSLWSDEGLTAWAVELPAGEFLEHIAFEAPHYAVYYSILRLFVAVFGTGEAALRSLSFASAIATVPFVYLIGQRLGPGRFAAIAASVLLIANAFVLNYAVETRVYAFVMLLVTAATWLLIVAVEDGRTRYWVAYVAVMSLAIWAHFYAFFLLPAHAAWLWYRASGARRPAALALLACLLASVPMGVMILVLGPDRAWLSAPSAEKVLLTLGHVAGWSSRGLLGPGLPLIYVVALASALAIWARRPQPTVVALVVLWIISPVVIGLLVSLVHPVFIARSLIVIVPGLALLLAAALAGLGRVYLAVPALLLVTALSAQHMVVSSRGYGDFRGAIATVGSRAEPGDSLLVVPSPQVWLTPRYYLMHDPSADDVNLLNRRGLDRPDLPPLLQPVADSGERLWLLLVLRRGEKDPPAASGLLAQLAHQGYGIVNEWQFQRLRLLLVDDVGASARQH